MHLYVVYLCGIFVHYCSRATSLKNKGNKFSSYVGMQNAKNVAVMEKCTFFYRSFPFRFRSVFSFSVLKQVITKTYNKRTYTQNSGYYFAMPALSAVLKDDERRTTCRRVNRFQQLREAANDTPAQGPQEGHCLRSIVSRLVTVAFQLDAALVGEHDVRQVAAYVGPCPPTPTSFALLTLRMTWQ